MDTSVLFNINSASHRNNDAVLGQIVLDLAIKNVDGDEQLIRQKCLILRPELQLQLVLLGNDFLLKNSVGISYDDLSGQMTIKINKEII